MTKHNIAWIDTETTGLDAQTDKLLEIAVIITDQDLNEISEFHAVVRYTQLEVANMMFAAGAFVQKMHAETGLWRKLWESGSEPLKAIERNLLEWLQLHGEPKTMPVGGNSVRLDMNFIDKHLPSVGAYLSHHMRDVSTVAGFASDWYDLPWFEKASDHTAMTDIRECLREIRHYQDAVFKTPGGSVSETSATIDEIAAVLMQPRMHTNTSGDKQRSDAEALLAKFNITPKE